MRGLIFYVITASYMEESMGTCNIADNEKCEATETMTQYIREGILNV